MVIRRPALVLVVATLQAGAPPLAAQSEPPSEPPADWGVTAIDYSNVPYPHPVSYLDVLAYGQSYRMAYMDVAPTGEANGRTVMLFHGMNFTGAAFAPTIEALSSAGFRVIAIDRLGWGRSSKPLIHYRLGLWTSHAKALLDHLGIDRAAVLGHSMGGMVVTRFAFSYPETTTHVVMVNQIGLSDSRPRRPWSDPYESFEGSAGTSYRSVLGTHLRYYPNGWRPEYMDGVRVQYGLTLSGDWPHMSRVWAMLRQVISDDPVVYDWQHVGVKALVIGGADDRLVADFPAAARHVAEELQNAELVLFAGIGHNPFVEIPDRFHAEVVRFLRSGPDEPADQRWRQTDLGRR